MTRYTHPLNADDLDQDETHEMNDVDVTVNVSPDGKRVRLTVIDSAGEETAYKLGGVTLNGAPIRADEPLNLYGVDAVIEWQAGGLGLYPGVDVKVTRDLGGEN